jgi:hypothetical protein
MSVRRGTLRAIADVADAVGRTATQMQTMNDDEEMLRRWRSWVDKGAMPPEFKRNLWDEFYALQHRTDQWGAFLQMVLASPQEAQHSARWLVQFVRRSYVESQTSAIRRFAYSGNDPRPMAFGKILRGVTERPGVFGPDASHEAGRDLALLRAKVEAVDTFADKFVAHLDPDHGTAVPAQSFAEMDETVAVLSPLWGRWYERITGKGVATDLVPETGWASFLRLERRPGPYESLIRSISSPPPEHRPT